MCQIKLECSENINRAVHKLMSKYIRFTQTQTRYFALNHLLTRLQTNFIAQFVYSSSGKVSFYTVTFIFVKYVKEEEQIRHKQHPDAQVRDDIRIITFLMAVNCYVRRKIIIQMFYYAFTYTAGPYLKIASKCSNLAGTYYCIAFQL